MLVPVRSKGSPCLKVSSFALPRVRLCGLATVIPLIAVPFAFLSSNPERVLVALALLPALVWIAWSDLRTRLVPDLATAWIALLGGAVCLLADQMPLITAATAVAVMLALGSIGEVYWRLRQVDPLGLGDVKLIGAGTLLVGAEQLWLMILLASVGGITTGLLCRGADQTIPFAPFLAYAILIVFLIGD